MSGKFIVIQPNGPVYIIQITEKRWYLKDVQAIVNGYIEKIKVRYEGRVRDAYVNEDGISMGLQFNREATELHFKYLEGRLLEYLPIIVGKMAIWIPDPRKKKNV